MMSHLLVHKGCVESAFEFATVAWVLVGQMVIWQKWLASWARHCNTHTKINPIHVHKQVGHSVF